MKKISKVNVFVFIFLLFFVFYPLVQMLVQVDWADFNEIINSLAFKEALNNSLIVTSISTLISIILAYILAFTINRTPIKHRAVLQMLITVPMLIPSISHGLGLINLFGNNGIISKMFDFNIIGPTGIIIGSVLYSFPVAFLMFCDGFNYVDNNLYNTAKVLGLNKWQTFKKVTLCYMKKPLISAVFAVFTMIFTDYGVPLAVGGKFLTLPVYLYKEVIGLLNFSSGTIIGLFLLIPAFISFMFDYLSKDFSNGNYNKEFNFENNKKRDMVLTIFVYLIIGMIFLIIGSFIYFAFIDNPRLNPVFSLKHFEYVLNNNILKFIINSLLISIFTAIIGTIITYFTAYSTARINNKVSKIIHLLAISSLAIPGIVLGLSYTISFSGTFIYNTFIILIIVNIIHFMASPYLMAYNALKKVDPNYEVVAKTYNISSFKIIKDVIIPCTKKTIREMICYFFVNSMITISAVAFLFNTRTMPLSLLINTYEGNMLLGEAAIISLIILFFNIIAKSVVYLINRKENRSSKNAINN